MVANQDPNPPLCGPEVEIRGGQIELAGDDLEENFRSPKGKKRVLFQTCARFEWYTAAEVRSWCWARKLGNIHELVVQSGGE